MVKDIPDSIRIGLLIDYERQEEDIAGCFTQCQNVMRSEMRT